MTSTLLFISMCILPGINAFLGGTDSRCYMQSCHISMTTLVNTQTILSSMSGRGSDMSSVIYESEARVMTNLTQGVSSSDQMITSEIQNVTTFLTEAVATLKAEVLADLMEGCAEGLTLSQAAGKCITLILQDICSAKSYRPQRQTKYR